MNAQFKKGVLEICVLAKIHEHDRYGYEVVQLLSKYMEVNEGTVYPILRRLTKEGYFTTYMKESSEGPARKYYSITDNGKVFLAQSVQEWKSFTSIIDQLLKEASIHDDETRLS